MFKEVTEIQSFLTWCRDNGIQKVKVKGVEVEFSALSFLPTDDLKDISGGASTSADPKLDQQAEDEDLLFYSAK